MQYGRCLAYCVGCENETRIFENMTYNETMTLVWHCPGCATMKMGGYRSIVNTRLGFNPDHAGLLPARTKRNNEFTLYAFVKAPSFIEDEERENESASS